MPKVAIVLGNGYEDSEFEVPKERLMRENVEFDLIGSRRGEVVHGKKGESEAVIGTAAEAVEPDAYDALLIPGGRSPASLRDDAKVVGFVRDFYRSGKPVAAICHGPQLLAEAGVLEGVRLTSWPEVRREMEESGADWVDEEVVVDDNLITSRKPADLDAFCDTLVRTLR